VGWALRGVVPGLAGPAFDGVADHGVDGLTSPRLTGLARTRQQGQAVLVALPERLFTAFPGHGTNGVRRGLPKRSRTPSNKRMELTGASRRPRGVRRRGRGRRVRIRAPAPAAHPRCSTSILKSVRSSLPLSMICLVLALQATPSASAVEAPQHLELRLSDTDGMARIWSIEVIPSGEVTRVGDAPLGPRHLPPEARERLRSLLATQQFFTLDRAYGRCAIDGRQRMITAKLNGKRHAILLCDLPSTGAGADSRALLRVWYGALEVLAERVQIERDDARILEQRP
jgi:hypothetical protein